MQTGEEETPDTTPRAAAQVAGARAGAEAEKVRLWQEGRLAVR